MIFQQNEIAYQKFIEEFDETYKQYAITQAKASALEKMKLKLTQAEEKLKFMQVEVQDCQPHLKSDLTQKLKQHKMSYADGKRKLRDIEQYRFQEPKYTPPPTNSAIANTNKLDEQSNALQHLHQKLEGTAETTDNILVELKDQKEKLLRATEDIRCEINWEIHVINQEQGTVWQVVKGGYDCSSDSRQHSCDILQNNQQMTSTVYTQNETNFLKKVDDFNNHYKQYSMTQSKQITFSKLQLSFVQAEQQVLFSYNQFKFMEIEFGACNEQTQQELSGKYRQHKQVYFDCQKKLREIQLDLEKQPSSAVNSGSKKQQPQPISGLNSDLKDQTKQLVELDTRLLEAEDTSVSILDNLRSQKEKLLKAIEDTKEIRTGVQQTQRHATMIKNRESYNKGILMSLVCILTIGNILIIYYKFVN